MEHWLYCLLLETGQIVSKMERPKKRHLFDYETTPRGHVPAKGRYE